MRRVLVVGLAAVLIPAMAAAQTEPAPLADFTSLCEETASTGFNWKNGTWVQVNFKPEKYIVRKVSNAEDRPKLEQYEYDGCQYSKRGNDLNVDSAVAQYDGCYGVANVGEKPSFEWCRETYGQVGGAWVVLNITCSGSTNFYFAPDALFYRSSLHGDVTLKPISPLLADKPSLALSHGKCTVIQ